jgi:hypothetical protein
MSGELIRGNFGRFPGEPARKEPDTRSPKEKVIETILEYRALLGDDISKPGFRREFLELVRKTIKPFSPEEQDEILALVGVQRVSGDNVSK